MADGVCPGMVGSDAGWMQQTGDVVYMLNKWQKYKALEHKYKRLRNIYFLLYSSNSPDDSQLPFIRFYLPVKANLLKGHAAWHYPTALFWWKGEQTRHEQHPPWCMGCNMCSVTMQSITTGNLKNSPAAWPCVMAGNPTHHQEINSTHTEQSSEADFTSNICISVL